MRTIRRAMRRLTGGVERLDPTARVARLESEVAELRVDIDELRRDSARIAELYDLVHERLREMPDRRV